MVMIIICIASAIVGIALQTTLNFKQRAEMYMDWNRRQMEEIDRLRRLVDTYETERRSGNDTGGETQDNGGDCKEPPKTVFTAQTGS